MAFILKVPESGCGADACWQRTEGCVSLVEAERRPFSGTPCGHEFGDHRMLDVLRNGQRLVVATIVFVSWAATAMGAQHGRICSGKGVVAVAVSRQIDNADGDVDLVPVGGKLAAQRLAARRMVVGVQEPGAVAAVGCLRPR